jgi:hypothetical protein
MDGREPIKIIIPWMKLYYKTFAFIGVHSRLVFCLYHTTALLARASFRGWFSAIFCFFNAVPSRSLAFIRGWLLQGRQDFPNCPLKISWKQQAMSFSFQNILCFSSSLPSFPSVQKQSSETPSTLTLTTPSTLAS